jgi:hypothetical protein
MVDISYRVKSSSPTQLYPVSVTNPSPFWCCKASNPVCSEDFYSNIPWTSFSLHLRNIMQLYLLKVKLVCTYVGFEVFTAVTMKNAVFWDVAPCRSCVKRRLQWPTHALSSLADFIPWRWRWYVPPKRRFTQDLYGATSQKTAFFSVPVSGRGPNSKHS